MAPEIGPKSSGTFEKEAPAHSWPDSYTGRALDRHRRGQNLSTGQAFLATSYISSAHNCEGHSMKTSSDALYLSYINIRDKWRQSDSTRFELKMSHSTARTKPVFLAKWFYQYKRICRG